MGRRAGQPHEPTARKAQRERDRIADEEANIFAAFLLMPNPAFRSAMAEVNDLLDEEALAKVAKLFKVSVPILIYRQHLENRLRNGR